MSVPTPDAVDRLRRAVLDVSRRRGLSVREAANELGLIGADSAALESAVSLIREEGRRNQMLKVPGGMESLEYRRTQSELQSRRWYVGPSEGDTCWPAFSDSLRVRGFDEDAIKVVDTASTKIVSYLGDPGVFDLQTKGLVVGNVQSGKTSNYMAVISKAADAGYRLFIVLSGMHNQLRQQTQRRLDQQIVDRSPAALWYPLTYPDRDFHTVSKGAALLSQTEMRILAVTKKNPSRLGRVKQWLEDMPPDIRRRCPTLIIDDEADQATPNTKKALEDRSTINGLICDIVDLLPTVSYVGYTATPFANVFIDPTAENLYPSNFIISLERPDGYFGAEEVFGRNELDAEDEPQDGLDMVRTVPRPEAEVLTPPRKAEERASYQPELTDSLRSAVRYFIMATAARWCRGQHAHHSSMLIHTTHYSAVHIDQKELIRAYVDELRRGFSRGKSSLISAFQAEWEDEADRVDSAQFGLESLEFNDLVDVVPDVLQAVRVVADNHISSDRLSYDEVAYDEAGHAVMVPQTVIAVGGNTLSRGLTLEGLVVSYFVRAGRAYDTLLQMGRWFGFRRGYEDLPRVWLTASLYSQFRFLAMIEEEIRVDLERFELESMTPQDFGLRVRCHPEMMITASSKMRAVQTVSLSYSGERLQTFLFRHRDRPWLTANIEAAKKLVHSAIRSNSEVDQVDPGRFVIREVHADRVLEFLESYRFHEHHSRLRSDLLTDYIRNRVEQVGELEWWNVAVMGRRDASNGSIDLGLGQRVPLITRAQLNESPPGKADIKALMSKPDRVVDLDITRAAATAASEAKLQSMRRPGDPGLLLLYPIDKDSQPSAHSVKVGSRKALDAEEHVIGIGLVFPESAGSGETLRSYEFDYVAVRIPDSDDPLLEDEEGVEEFDLSEIDTELDAMVEVEVVDG